MEFDRRKLKTGQLDDSLTPLEIVALLNDGGGEGMLFAIDPLLQNGQAPVPYLRDDWSADASFFTANCGARSLVVVFCGGANRPGVPISYFLQMMRADLYDVLILRDPRRLHYDHGVRGLSQTMLETVRRIETFATSKGYGEVITFGTSMGGFPALRAGMLLRASRSISVSGGYCDHVVRLKSGGECIRAFDPLCSCCADYDLPMIVVAAGRHKADVTNLEILRRTFPQCSAVTVDTARHAVTGYFYYTKLIRLFFSCLFDNWEGPLVAAQRISLMDQAAKQIDQLEAQRRSEISDLRRAKNAAEENLRRAKNTADEKFQAYRLRQEIKLAEISATHEQKLERLYGSTSWRLTRPLRAIGATLRRFQLSWRRALLGPRGLRRR